jgi:CRP-like cAMP-binding protein
MIRADSERILRSVGWLSHQPEKFQTKLLRHAELVELARDKDVFNAGDPSGGVYGIVDGAIGSFIPSNVAGLRLATIMRTGVWFGYGPLITGQPRTLAFHAYEPTVMMKVHLATVRRISLEDPEARLHLATLADQATTIAIRVVHDLLIRKTKRRLAATLLRVAGDVDGRISSGKQIRLSQAMLAEMANTSRQSANQTLNEFEQSGWIAIGYEHVQIRNPASLKQFAYATE